MGSAARAVDAGPASSPVPSTHKYVAIAERMAGLIPDATLEVIEGAGHSVPLEQPDAFAGALDGVDAA